MINMSGAIVAAVTAFNLICTGTFTIGTMEEGDDGVTVPATERYRIDLKAKRFCENECETSEPIVSVTKTTIVLVDLNTATVKGYTTINRENGRLERTMSFPGGVLSYTEATCELQPFTSLPKRKF